MVCALLEPPASHCNGDSAGPYGLVGSVVPAQLEKISGIMESFAAIMAACIVQQRRHLHFYTLLLPPSGGRGQLCAVFCVQT